MNESDSRIEIFEKKPEGFVPHVQVSGCYLEIDNKLLLLQRAYGNFESGKWGVPAGKLEGDETPLEGAKRELFEETGISPKNFQQVNSLYIQKPEVAYVFHLFKVELDQIPEVILSNEHQSYKWATPKEIEELPLMAGANEALQLLRTSFVKKRSFASVNAYLILEQENKILFHLRKNTGYCDGMWGLVAGHVEDGESSSEAMIREAREEIGIELNSSQIRVVHVMHRQTNRLNVDIFFNCTSWLGAIENCEPEKCEKLEFFSLDALPSNIMDYQVTALKAIKKGEFYSEQGWF